MLDMNFDTVKDIRLPLFGIEENDYSMASLDYFDKYRITRHTFNNDDKIEIIYGLNQYHADCDCEMMNLYLVDEDGNIIQDIAEQISGVKRLLDIPGQEDEYAISMSQGDGISGFQMFRMPDMEKGFFFPANLNGDQLSSTFDRAVNVNGGYDYIFALGMGEADDETTYGIIARYDQEGQPTQRIQINIGKNGAVFSPLFNASTLNPYTFVPDEEMEYLYMSATLDDAGMHRRLGIATAEKNLYVIDDNPEHGSIANAGLLRDMAGTKNHAMFVSFSPDGISVSKTIFYQLPLETPDTLQGQGTEEDPYVITNAFELDQIRNYPDAYFILGNDIDMASYSGLDGSGFISIPEFYGHLDGSDHAAGHRRIHDPLQDQRADEQVPRRHPGRMYPGTSVLQHLSERPVRHHGNDDGMHHAVCCICNRHRTGPAVSDAAGRKAPVLLSETPGKDPGRRVDPAIYNERQSHVRRTSGTWLIFYRRARTVTMLWPRWPRFWRMLASPA